MRLQFRLGTALVALTLISLLGSTLQGPYAALLMIAAVELLALLGCAAWIFLWTTTDSR